MEEKSSKRWIVGVVMLVLGLFGIVVVAGAVKGCNARVSPLMARSVTRDCDFIGIDESTWVACVDGTLWKIAWEATPDTSRIVEEPIRGSQGQITISADDDHGPKREDGLQQIRYSYYWPPLCGDNCSQCVNGECISKMANQERWQDHVGEAVACPPEWEFGTVVELDGQRWTCRDRGGKIQYVNGIPWVDFLRENAAYPYGTIVKVRVIEKGE